MYSAHFREMANSARLSLGHSQLESAWLAKIQLGLITISISFESPDIGAIYLYLVKSVAAVLRYDILVQSYLTYMVHM